MRSLAVATKLGVPTIEVEGGLETEEERQELRTVLKAKCSCSNIILDLGKVSSVSADLVGMLAALHARQINRNGALVLINVPGVLLEALASVGIKDVFSIHADRGLALKSFILKRR